MPITLQAQTFSINALDGVLDSRVPAGVSGNRAPVVASIPNQTAVQGGFFSVGQYASDPDGDSLTWVVTGGNAPAGVGLSSLGSGSVGASVPPGTYTISGYVDDGVNSTFGITDPTAIVALNVPTIPAPLGTLFDSRYQVGIKRIIAPPGINAANAQGPRLKPFYSNQQAWNSDNTLLMLMEGDGFCTIFDATTYVARVNKIAAGPNGFGSIYRWSPDEPYTIYYVGGAHNLDGAVQWAPGITPGSGAVVAKAVINPATWAVTYTVVGRFPAYSELYAAGSGDMLRRDVNGKLWIGLSNNLNQAWLYNITDQVSTPLISPVSGSVRLCVPTPKADGIMILYSSEGTARGQGLELFNLSGAYIKQITPATGHLDWCIDTAGVQWCVYYENGNMDGLPAIVKARIDGATPQRSVLLQLPYNGQGAHISCQNTLSQVVPGKDFAVVSFERQDGRAQVALAEEVFLVFMDSTASTPHIIRLCQHRSWYASYGYGQPHATIRNDGKKIIFGSNWGRYDGSNVGTQMDTFEIDLGALGL